MSESKARYEFRIWGETLAGLQSKLEQRAAPSPDGPHVEIYLLSAATDKCNAKIRSGLLDIKVLVGTERNLEQWKPVLKADFPLARLLIAEQVFPALEVPVPQLTRAQYGREQFLDEVMGRQPKIICVPVSKSRLQFRLDACQAEFASAAVGAISRDSVAVESTDPDAVLRLTGDLGIARAPNISYVRQLKLIVGM